jgi:hypothetical protein
MLAGMYAVHDGTTYQVAKIAGSYTTGPSGMPKPASLYYLQPLDGGALVFVTNPGPSMTLTPACDACGLPAGFGACSARGVHDGPLPTRQLTLRQAADRYDAARDACAR